MDERKMFRLQQECHGYVGMFIEEQDKGSEKKNRFFCVSLNCRRNVSRLLITFSLHLYNPAFLPSREIRLFPLFRPSFLSSLSFVLIFLLHTILEFSCPFHSSVLLYSVWSIKRISTRSLYSIIITKGHRTKFTPFKLTWWSRCIITSISTFLIELHLQHWILQ